MNMRLKKAPAVFTLIFVLALVCSTLGVRPRQASAADPGMQQCLDLASGNSQYGNSIVGFGVFQSSIPIGPDGFGSVVFRTYLCNGGDEPTLYDDTQTADRGTVQSTGRTDVFDYSGISSWRYSSTIPDSGYPGGAWIQSMIGWNDPPLQPHTIMYKDVTFRVDGSKFNGPGDYWVIVKGGGYVCSQRGCGQTNIAESWLRVRVTVPQANARCGAISFSPADPLLNQDFKVTAQLILNTPNITPDLFTAKLDVDKPNGNRISRTDWPFTRDGSSSQTITQQSGNITNTGGLYTVHARLTGPSWFTPLDCTATLNGSSATTNQPYVQFRRGDVWTGGKFGKYNAASNQDDIDPQVGTCGFAGGNDKPGNIYTHGHIDSGNNVGGSFVDYGAFVNGDPKLEGTSSVKNFFSQALNKADQPSYVNSTGGKLLMFSNQTSAPGLGHLEANQCIHDYYGQLAGAVATDTAGAVDLSSLSDGVHQYNGDVTISAPGRLDNKHLSLVVNGDITIQTDIRLADASSGRLTNGGTLDQQLSQISSLLMVAKGNILIKSSVGTVEGILVAQTKGGFGSSDYQSSGIIDDCVDSGSGSSFDVTSAAFRAQCLNPSGVNNTVGPGRLTVVGSLTARKLRLRRLTGDVQQNGSGPKNDTYQASHAAENITLSPESLFTAPPGSTETNKYDSVENLPPVL